MNRPDRVRGMTLIEVLVALAILSLLAAGVLTSFRLGYQSYRQLIRIENSQGELLGTQQLLRRILESAYPFEPVDGPSARGPFALQGTAQQLAVTAPMPLAGGGAGHYRYEILLRPNSTGTRDLAIRAYVDRHGQRPDGVATGGVPYREEVLIPQVESIAFAYLDRPDRLASAPAQWHNAWRQNPLPALVRLDVQFSPDDSRSWPTLVVDPRVTHAASCSFDAVSRDCRPVRQ